MILVDWAMGAKGPNYFQATANIRVVGAQTATLIKTLGQLGVDPSRVHVVGHSLGAQAASKVGDKFQSGTKISRITGRETV